MSFNVEEFASNPTKSGLNSLLKAQLKQLVEHLSITVGPSATKAELRKKLTEYFVEDLLSEEEEEVSDSVHATKLELKRLELEHQAREQERERECQLKMKELEIREKEMNAKREVELKEKELVLRKEEIKEKELELQLKLKEIEAKPADRPPGTEKTEVSFDVSRQIRLVPPFQE